MIFGKLSYEVTWIWWLVTKRKGRGTVAERGGQFSQCWFSAPQAWVGCGTSLGGTWWQETFDPFTDRRNPDRAKYEKVRNLIRNGYEKSSKYEISQKYEMTASQSCDTTLDTTQACFCIPCSANPDKTKLQLVDGALTVVFPWKILMLRNH